MFTQNNILVLMGSGSFIFKKHKKSLNATLTLIENNSIIKRQKINCSIEKIKNRKYVVLTCKPSCFDFLKMFLGDNPPIMLMSKFTELLSNFHNDLIQLHCDICDYPIQYHPSNMGLCSNCFNNMCSLEDTLISK